MTPPMRLRCSPAYCRAVADTLSWLFEPPPPAGAEIRLTDRRNARSHAKSQSPARSYGKRPSHPFFEHAIRYTDAPALERHINTDPAAMGQDLGRARGDGSRRHQAAKLPHRPSDPTGDHHRFRRYQRTAASVCQLHATTLSSF
ncbi:uncharacterized protein EI90DRAFT_3158757 [Cantharellus anzutake]|uniref:uncharacterized protein n=1 Tax=Cantharellus anzutake TaxID=1750568 RepID=UPI0019063502|nr:uncharacterized protein EI90DRAFT_3158757 [Cantharellus anzutake]KAF8317261.1 hypothetical protein EI90DRAFT_3158757 [Cantharellus anzutake]